MTKREILLIRIGATEKKQSKIKTYSFIREIAALINGVGALCQSILEELSILHIKSSIESYNSGLWTTCYTRSFSTKKDITSQTVDTSRDMTGNKMMQSIK